MAGGKKAIITRDDFECWLMEMDNSIGAFSTALPQNLKGQLDYSKHSLEVVEQWLLHKYSSISELLKPTEREILDGAAQYIGEVFRKHIGGHWDIELENQADAFYAIPKLTDFGPKSSPISPVSMTTALLDRRTGHYLSQILEKLEKRYRAPLA